MSTIKRIVPPENLAPPDVGEDDGVWKSDVGEDDGVWKSGAAVVLTG